MDPKNNPDSQPLDAQKVSTLLFAKGWVESVEADKAYVITQRTSGCHSCQSQQSCGTSVLSKLFSPVNTTPVAVDNSLGVQAGDEVELSMDESRLIHHSVMAYGLPLLGLFTGALLFQWGGDAHSNAAADLYSVFGAVFGLALGWSITRRFYRPQLPRLHRIIRRSNIEKEQE